MERLRIRRTAPVQENFLGVNAVYHGYAGMPDDAGRVYTTEQCELEADRIKALGVQVVRTYYKWWAWNRETGWNWENATMRAFYRWCERMQKRGIDIALHGGWCSPGDINNTWWNAPSPFGVEGDWEQSKKNYGDWVSETVKQLIIKRGFTNIFAKQYVEVNVSAFDAFEDNTEVNAQLLKEKGIIKKTCDGIVVLGNGEITKKIIVKAAKFTASAKAKIETAGGKAEVVK